VEVRDYCVLDICNPKCQSPGKPEFSGVELGYTPKQTHSATRQACNHFRVGDERTVIAVRVQLIAVVAFGNESVRVIRKKGQRNILPNVGGTIAAVGFGKTTVRMGVPPPKL